MHIEITSPEVEALVRERMAIGGFTSPEQAIFDALRRAPSSDVRPRYSLNELLQAYDPETLAEDRTWLDLPPVGREL